MSIHYVLRFISIQLLLILALVSCGGTTSGGNGSAGQLDPNAPNYYFAVSAYKYGGAGGAHQLKSGPSNYAGLRITSARVVNLSWDIPTEHIDNTPLNDLAGFIIYYTSVANGEVNSITINDPMANSYQLSIP